MTVAAIALFVVGLPVAAQAVVDRTPPVVVGFDFAPAAVDISGGSAQVLVTITATDNDTGIDWVRATFVEPSQTKSVSVTLYDPANRISGSVTDGVYQGYATIPVGSEPGSWTAALLDFRDRGGNYGSMYTAAFDPSWPTELEVTDNWHPVAVPSGPYSATPLGMFTVDGTGSFDPDNDSLEYVWHFADDLNGPTTKLGATVSFQAPATAGIYPVTLTVNDGNGGTDSAVAFVVVNTPPAADPNGPYLAAVLDVFSLDGTGSSDSEGDQLDYTWSFGGTDQSGPIVSFLAPATPGIFPVTLTVEDGIDSDVASTYVVVYDPSAGFVTGGGWIDSPAGAYRPDTLLTGKATFGFVSKYAKGSEVPTGNTEFQFQAGDLNLHSSSYQWLVVTGSHYAMFKGEGTINGTGEYKFKIWAGDDEPDTFRIKIWTEDEFGNETVLYDNGADQSIGGGTIVIHTRKK